MKNCIALIPAALLLATQTALGQPAQAIPISPKARARIDQAAREAAVKDQAAAKQRYERAKSAAPQGAVADPKTALDYGRSVERLAAVSGDDAKLKEAEQVYVEALRASPADQAWLARYRLGQVRLKQDDPDGAVAEYQRIDVTKVDETERFKVSFGYAQALERSAETKASGSDRNNLKLDAYRQYRAAFDAQPDFTQAAENAMGVLAELDRPNDVAEFIDFALSKNRKSIAEKELPSALSRWRDDPQGKRVLASLVRYYAAASTTPGQYLSGEGDFTMGRAFLRETVPPGSRLAQAADQITRAFTPDWRPWADSSEVRRIFSEWSCEDWSRSSMSQLLQSIGEHYGRVADPTRSAAAYSAAWGLDRLNIAAAVATAGVLLRYSSDIDPRGRLLDRLVEAAFVEKGEFYATGDWPNILKMHVLLGTIFESLERWDGGGADNALFQWTNAAIAAQRLSAPQPLSSVAGVFGGLAHTQMELGDRSAAIKNYLIAGEAVKAETGTTSDIAVIEGQAARASESFGSARVADRNVLWVDDRPENNRFERNAFEQVDVQFVNVTSSAEAIKAFQIQKFDAVITDFRRRADEQGGFAVLERLKALEPTTPVIIYSSTATPDQVREAKRRGAYGQTNSAPQLFEMVLEAIRGN